jgi:hypothetical protein
MITKINASKMSINQIHTKWQDVCLRL